MYFFINKVFNTNLFALCHCSRAGIEVKLEKVAWQESGGEEGTPTPCSQPVSCDRVPKEKAPRP